MTVTIDGITFTATEDLPEAEVSAYVGRGREKYGRYLRAIHAAIDGDFVDLTYDTAPTPFERIRRITGYLVGAMPRWNDAKRAEEHDRVKHTLEGT